MKYKTNKQKIEPWNKVGERQRHLPLINFNKIHYVSMTFWFQSTLFSFAVRVDWIETFVIIHYWVRMYFVRTRLSNIKNNLQSFRYIVYTNFIWCVASDVRPFQHFQLLGHVLPHWMLDTFRIRRNRATSFLPTFIIIVAFYWLHRWSLEQFRHYSDSDSEMRH